jgi:hypothetical protein
MKTIAIALPFVAMVVLSLSGALWSALQRLGFTLPFADIAAFHGPLMISAFLGTVIVLERIKALKLKVNWLAAIFSGLAGLLIMSTQDTRLAYPLFVLASFGMVLIFIQIIRIQKQLFNVILALAALGLFVANTLLMLGKTIPQAVPFWIVFLVLTITGERLELNRLMRPRPLAKKIFTANTLLMLIAAGLSLWDWFLGMRLIGLSLLTYGLWLSSEDIARRTIRLPGLTRFVAFCLLSGYGWLIFGGLLMMRSPIPAGLMWDAQLHSIFLGFVFAMIFGHAPIILPALTGLRVRFTKIFYAPIILLHLTLTLRITADLLGLDSVRQHAGISNVIVVLLFLAVLISHVSKPPTFDS